MAWKTVRFRTTNLTHNDVFRRSRNRLEQFELRRHLYRFHHRTLPVKPGTQLRDVDSRVDSMETIFIATG